MFNVYWVAKNIRYYYTKTKNVHDLVDLQLSYFSDNTLKDAIPEKILKDLRKDTTLSINYRSDNSTKEFLQNFNGYLTSNMLSSIKESPFRPINR